MATQKPTTDVTTDDVTDAPDDAVHNASIAIVATMLADDDADAVRAVMTALGMDPTWYGMPLTITIPANKFMSGPETFDLTSLDHDNRVGALTYGIRQVCYDGGAGGKEIADADKIAGTTKRIAAVKSNSHTYGAGGGTSLDVACRPYLLAYLIEIGLAAKTSDAEKIRKANGKNCRVVYDAIIRPHLVAANPTVDPAMIDEDVWTVGIEKAGKADMVKPIVKLTGLKLVVAKADPAPTA